MSHLKILYIIIDYRIAHSINLNKNKNNDIINFTQTATF